MACLGNFAFASATQGWFITRNRYWEIPLLLGATLVLFQPALIAGWLQVPWDMRYWVYLIGIALVAMVLVMQWMRSKTEARVAE